MFGKHQPDVVTEQDVGDYIEELKVKGSEEVNNFIMEDDDELAGNSPESTSGSKDKN